MASSNFSTVLSLSLALFLLLLTQAYSDDFSFNFKSFDQSNLILQGDAVVSTAGRIRLTKVKGNGKPTPASLGRAFYSAPIKIWDSTTGKVASWATSFTFNINAPNKSNSADGLAFALVPVGSEPKSNAGFLGLFDNATYDSSAQTVAVEFDTYSNPKWDPEPRHIGIDVNSIESIRWASWGLANGQNAEILITYDASTQLLVASLVHPSRRTSYIVSERVDLKSVLPETVIIGFSATTGLLAGSTETHDILSWSFASKLSDGNGITTGGLDLAKFVLNKFI
ncbi:lectin DB58-like [Vigna unguiculata]|uniref:Legume lectin n=1 Tax=Vigna unguiculata TaxID=3917 RepID=A0A4D6MVN1_VIGUN|nr:lectin DB58-like [Vigna unguiculata]QCE05550.1 Legume lectin [Vigna unguiculata]